MPANPINPISYRVNPSLPKNPARNRRFTPRKQEEPEEEPGFLSKIPRSVWIKLRVALLGGVVGGLFLIALLRAYALQTVESPALYEKATNMYGRDYTLTGARGIIYDRDMRELAVSLSVDSIFVDPAHMPEEEPERLAAIQSIAKTLSLDAKALEQKIRASKRFAWIKRFANPEEVEAIRALEIPGVDTVPEYKRFYPNRELGSHLLGFMTLDNQGEGIEYAYRDVLEGVTGSVPVVSLPNYGKVMTEGGVPASSLEGGSLVLSLSSQIQYIAERELEKAIAATRSKGGTVVVTDPNTGEIIALANWPLFNPNTPGESEAENRRNRAVTDSFEPGSTLKSFVYAAGLEEGLISPEEVVDCTDGALKVGDHTIHDSHKVGVTTWTGALAESSNICAYRVGQRLGAEKLYNYLAAFGFGKVPGLGLSAESAGVMHPAKKWREINLATISFGHGITVTALQQALGMGAIANGGTLYAPLLVKKIVGADGSLKKEFVPQVVGQPVSKKTTETLTEMLMHVTRKGGTATKAAMADYAVAGKTGTAQKVIDGRYVDGHYIASFVGFAPAKNAKLVIAVVLDDPVGQHYGGQICAPVFKTVMEESLRALGVPAEPDPENLVDEKKQPQPIPAPVVQPEAQSFTMIPVGDSRWKSRLTEGMPDFSGLTVKEALSLAQAKKLTLKIQGSGLAVSQEPAVGSDGGEVMVTFQ